MSVYRSGHACRCQLKAWTAITNTRNTLFGSQAHINNVLELPNRAIAHPVRRSYFVQIQSRLSHVIHDLPLPETTQRTLASSASAELWSLLRTE
jgi:hypothetical protein